MSNLDAIIKDLVIANRILAKEDVVDAYGHVSIRHPDNPKHFFLSRSLAPELIEKEDIVELGMNGQPVKDEKRPLYLERFIHAGILEARPDVNSVVHAHAEDILPFGIANGTQLRPVIHSGSFIGSERAGVGHRRQVRRTPTCWSPTWSRAATWRRCSAGNNVALMRGHGFASAARSLIEVVRMSVYLPRNARAADARQAARRQDRVSVAGRDRRPQRRLQPLFDRDLAGLGILGQQGELRPPADASRRRRRQRCHKHDHAHDAQEVTFSRCGVQSMKLASYIADGKPCFGVVTGDGVITMNERFGGHAASLREAIAGGALPQIRGSRRAWRAAGPQAVRYQFLPVIPNPEKIICVGINYKSHAAEHGTEAPKAAQHLHALRQHAGGA